MSNGLAQFTNQYKLSETLSFELRPVGKTAEMLEKSGLLEQDLKRAGFYAEVKAKLDKEHKKLLVRALADVPHALAVMPPKTKGKFQDILTADGTQINWNVLALSMDGKDSDQLKIFAGLQDHYRNLLVEMLKQDEYYAALTDTTPKKIFSEHLKTASEPEAGITAFGRFACYFKGFQENRKNIYSAESQTTAAANRLINENFPKFIAAIRLFNHLREHYGEILSNAAAELREQLNGRTLDQIFTPENYSTLLIQPGIDDFNALLGGTVTDAGIKIRGINEFINLYRQQHPQTHETRDRDLSPMAPLFKQILSDRESFSFAPEMFQDDAGVRAAIIQYKQRWETFECDHRQNAGKILQMLLLTLTGGDEHVFIAADQLSDISHKFLRNWSAIADAMSAYAQTRFTKAKERENWLKRPFYSVAELNALPISVPSEDGQAAERHLIEHWTKETTFFTNLEKTAEEVTPVLETAAEEKLRERETDVAKIKAYLDALQDLLHYVKPFQVENAPDPDANFYYVFQQLYGLLEQVIPLYNQVRNYMTQKAMETQKIKLMFGNPTLADGWDKNKEQDNRAIILRKQGAYYLGIMPPKSKTDFEMLAQTTEEDCYQKMIYKLLPGPNKTLPHVFFSEKGKKTFAPDAEILRKYESGCHKKSNPDFDPVFCHQLIDFFKQNIPAYGDWKTFDFHFSDTSSYTGIDDFYREITAQGYRLSFCNIPAMKIHELVDTGKLYLFQIYNKDFAPGAHGRPNKFTLYWQALFDPRNLQPTVFKLNGEAELFLREPGIEKTSVHHAGEMLVNRISRSGKPIPDAVFQEIFQFVNHRLPALSENAAKWWNQGVIIVKKATHDITKDRRFTQRKYLFHVPITLNYLSADPAAPKLNRQVIDYLRGNPEIKIIGIDRGERNLIYLTLIDQSGKILQQKNFNLIGTMDYHARLDQREKERDAARRSWKTIGKIKDLKAGYLSQVVHEIARIMVRENAIVVLEDLNFGFKRGRFAIEKQIYQKFEKALIDKLNYLVFKEINDWKQPGGVLNGYQLTSGFESFQKLGKQSGFLFYVNAAYTSKIDPTTGFVNLFNFKPYTNAASRRAFLEKFSGIVYDGQWKRFAFSFDYRDFDCRVKSWKTDWTVYSAETRLVFDSKNRKTKTVFPNSDILQALSGLGVEPVSGWDLKRFLSTLALNRGEEIQLVNTVFFSLERSLQMRNSNAGTGEDYIESPVLNRSHEFFRSVPGTPWPQDADANGAYHIAMKGLCLLQKMAAGANTVLKVENPEWLQFMQERNR